MDTHYPWVENLFKSCPYSLFSGRVPAGTHTHGQNCHPYEWEPTIKIKIKDHECYALCDLGASVSTISRTLCDVLGFREFDNCSLNLHFADSTIKKPMERINDVLIVANSNYVPVDFIVLDIDCNCTCHIILGRPFLRTIGAIIDMKEGNIRFQFPLRKSMEHFPRKKVKLPYESIMRSTYGLHTKDDNT